MASAVRGVTASRVLVSVLAALAAVQMPAASAAATTVFSGGCILTLEVHASQPVRPTPTLLTLDVSGGGTCVVTGVVAAMTFVGSVTTHATFGGFGCAGGVAAGQAFITLAVPGFSGLTLELTIVAAGGSVMLVATNSVLRFDGVAMLVQDTADTAACTTTGMTDTTWVGALAFQDPDPMPV